MQLGVPRDILNQIALQDMELTSDSFVDRQLKAYFTDVCYTTRTTDGNDLKVTILFEHKSESPTIPLSTQLASYIVQIRLREARQKLPPSVILPIVVYHGQLPLQRETPENQFPGISPHLVPFQFRFDYVFIDITRLEDERLDSLKPGILWNVLRALRHGRDDKYMLENWQKIITFAEVGDKSERDEVAGATLVYLNGHSKIINQKLRDMTTGMPKSNSSTPSNWFVEMYRGDLEVTVEELTARVMEHASVVDSAVIIAARKGVIQGIEQGIEQGLKLALDISSYLSVNQNASDEAIAAHFGISADLVRTYRQYHQKA